LDLCLTSNVELRVVSDLDHHPIRELVAAGVPVTSIPTTHRCSAPISTPSTLSRLGC
jgi:hypothetical protein